jgi:enoyl-CoA hydratase
MTSLVAYTLAEGIATLAMDDGKANVMSPAMLAELNAALDRAENDKAAVLLTGRKGVFSAGFDLKVLGAGGAAAFDMLMAGFRTAERLLAFNAPVIAACNGHALAMGVFLLAAADYVVAADGAFKSARTKWRSA